MSLIPLTPARRLGWGHITAAHAVAGIVAAGTVLSAALANAPDLSPTEFVVVGTMAIVAFLGALGGRYSGACPGDQGRGRVHRRGRLGRPVHAPSNHRGPSLLCRVRSRYRRDRRSDPGVLFAWLRRPRTAGVAGPTSTSTSSPNRRRRWSTPTRRSSGRRRIPQSPGRRSRLIQRAAFEVFPPSLQPAFYAVGCAETGLRIVNGPPNPNGTFDEGPWQLNSPWFAGTAFPTVPALPAGVGLRRGLATPRAR